MSRENIGPCGFPDLTFDERITYFPFMKEIARYSRCFVCGDRNEVGLKARFYFDESAHKAICTVTAEEAYAGYRNIFHGGITATLLDEIMIKSLLAENLYVVTAEMTVKYRRPVYTGDTLRFEGWKTGRRGSLFLTAGRAVNQHAEVVAEASGKYIRPDSEFAAKLLESVSE